jgi:molybdate transport system ATP-binding protein
LVTLLPDLSRRRSKSEAGPVASSLEERSRIVSDANQVLWECNRMSDDKRAIVRLKDATLRVRDRFILPGTNWEIGYGQNWAVVGPNGAGKTSLMRAVIGDLPVVSGSIERVAGDAGAPVAGYVSFELHRAVIAGEDRRDASRIFSGNLNDRTTAEQVIRRGVPRAARHSRALDRVVDALGIGHLLNRGVRNLSTGEMRKVLIAGALAKMPRLLVLDEPFDGLDPSARRRLKQIIGGLITDRTQLILVTHRKDEILPEITHVLRLGNGRVMSKGPKSRVLAGDWDDGPANRARRPPAGAADRPEPAGAADGRVAGTLVHMANVTVRYGHEAALDQLSWTVKNGENWAVVGPNGSGKSTLLQLISADLPQAYANEIHLFGRRRGSGESIWEIKRNIGVVGASLHIRYRQSITAQEAVLSGFFDSVGLYRRCTPEQRQTAARWMAFLGISHLADKHFERLSYGEQRLILIARAVVKSPLLLLLDEPCQGLDGANRRMVLDLIDVIGSRTRSNLVYVTHHEDEMVPCINHVLRLENQPQTAADERVERTQHGFEGSYRRVFPER